MKTLKIVILTILSVIALFLVFNQEEVDSIEMCKRTGKDYWCYQNPSK